MIANIQDETQKKERLCYVEQVCRSNFEPAIEHFRSLAKLLFYTYNRKIRDNSHEVHRLSSLPSKMGHVIYGGVLLWVLGHNGKVMQGDRGNGRTEKATSQNISEMTKIIDGGLISL